MSMKPSEPKCESGLEKGASVETQKPTLKTIAKTSGLAIATVSRALADAPDIAATTKEHVRKIADQLGYVPNRAGLRLRTGRTNVVSLVLPTEVNMMNHTAKLITSITAHLSGTNFHLNVTPWLDSENPMTPIRHIVENGLADGLILNSTTAEDPRVRYLQDRNFPFATHGRTNWCDTHPYFDFDNFIFAKASVAELTQRGCREILALIPPAHTNYSQNIKEGLIEQIQATDAKIHFFQKAHADHAPNVILEEAKQIVDAHPSIDGVFSSAPLAAISILSMFENRGRVLGENLEIASREAIPFLNVIHKNFIVTHEDVGRAGAFLAKAILQAIEHPQRPPLQGLDVPDHPLPMSKRP